MATTLCIESSKSPLPSRTPNLMPFHIEYSGPAPVSTYFRVKSVPPPTYGTIKEETVLEPSETQTATDSQETVVDEPSANASASSSSSTLPTFASASSSETLVDEVAVAVEGILKVSLQRHFTAAFRGRAMHGLEVELPEGYSGMVLRAPGANETTVSRNDEELRSGRKGKSKRSLRAAELEKDEDEEMHDLPEDIDKQRRSLRPTATFSSFVLWNPDIPVDEGRDEYIRSLTEWTRLSAEIHHFEE